MLKSDGELMGSGVMMDGRSINGGKGVGALCPPKLYYEHLYKSVFKV